MLAAAAMNFKRMMNIWKEKPSNFIFVIFEKSRLGQINLFFGKKCLHKCAVLLFED